MANKYKGHERYYELPDWARGKLLPSCTHKTRYEEQWRAVRVVRRLEREEPELHLKTYFCQMCGFWHLARRT